MREVPNFDRLTQLYETLERLTFCGALWRRRVRYLSDSRVANAKRALLLGDGDGRFVAALAARYPELELTTVDASAAMLEAQQRRVALVSPRSKLELQLADLRDWSPTGVGYDLVVSHFAFDCFTPQEVAELVARIAPALAPDASWLVSEFALPPQGPGRLLWRLLIGTLYLAQRRITGLQISRIPDYATSLRAAGFQRSSLETECGGALRSELWQRS